MPKKAPNAVPKEPKSDRLHDEDRVVQDIKEALVVLKAPPTTAKTKPLPPVERFKRTSEHWLSLFRSSDPDTSHTVELADDLPLFIYSREKKGPELKAVEREFVNRGRQYRIAILPAALKVQGAQSTEERKDDWKRRFPGEREELVMEVVKHLASQKALVLDGDLGVPFTLSEICKILEESGHTMRRIQVKEALQVLSRCKFIVTDVAGKTVIEESPFKTLILAERGSREEGVLQLNSFHTRAIERGDYRGLNFLVAISYQSVLARRIHKHIGHYVTNAVVGTPFKATASELMRLAALSLEDKPNKWVRKVDKALDEMKSAGYVASFQSVPTKAGGRVQDYLYTIHLTHRFVDEIIRSNAEQRRRKFQLGMGHNVSEG